MLSMTHCMALFRYLQVLPSSAELINEPPMPPPHFNMTHLDLPEEYCNAMDLGRPRPLVPASHAIANHLFVDTQVQLLADSKSFVGSSLDCVVTDTPML